MREGKSEHVNTPADSEYEAFWSFDGVEGCTVRKTLEKYEGKAINDEEGYGCILWTCMRRM